MKMILAAAALLLFSAAASAASTIDSAAQCLTDSTNGRDRKALVRWIFVAMSRHPAIEDVSAVSKDELDASSRTVGKLFTRLIAEDCAGEIRAMVDEHGATSISKAFEVLGAVAMTEIMSHEDVAAALAGLEKHSDQERIAEAMRGKPSED